MLTLTQEELQDIRENPDEVDWVYVSTYPTLSEDFIKEFQDKVKWKYVSTYQTLSENFIKEFQDKVNWDRVSVYQTLFEDFIREFQDKVDWFDVSYGQPLSEDFVKEFQDKLYDDAPTICSQMVSYDEIMSYEPCEDGVERYLEHTSKEEQITWNQLLKRHKDKSDIKWLFNERWNKR